MTDEEEFSAAPSSNGRGRATHGYCSIAAGDLAAWSPTRTTPACGDRSKSTASKRRPTVLSTGN